MKHGKPPSLNALCRLQGTLAGLRQRFVGNHYSPDHIKSCGLVFVEVQGANGYYEHSIAPPDRSPYFRADFLFVFDAAGCLLDIEGHGYRRDGAPYREALEWMSTPLVKPIACMLEHGIVKPAPDGPEAEWEELAGDFPLSDELRWETLPVQRSIQANQRFASELGENYAWAMRCATGVVRHAAYSPLPSMLLWWAGVLANRERPREAALLLRHCLHWERVCGKVLSKSASVFAKLGMPVEALSSAVRAVWSNGDSEDAWEELWCLVEDLLPGLVRSRRLEELDRVLAELEPLAEDASARHFSLVHMASGICSYLDDDLAGAQYEFDTAVRSGSPFPLARELYEASILREVNPHSRRLGALLDNFPDLPGKASEPPEQLESMQPVTFVDRWHAVRPAHTTACMSLFETLETSPAVAQVEGFGYQGVSLIPDCAVVTHAGARCFIYVNPYEGDPDDGHAIAWGSEAAKRAYAETKGMTPHFFIDIGVREVADGYEVIYSGLEQLEAALRAEAPCRGVFSPPACEGTP